MMKNRLFCIVSIIAAAFTQAGCGGVCGTPIDEEYDIGDVQASVHQTNPELADRQFGVPKDQLSDDRAITSEQFLLVIRTTEETGYAWRWPQISVNLISQAHACSRDPGKPWPSNKIQNITITSNAQLSSQYPAGESLNDAFRVQGIRKSQYRPYPSDENNDGVLEFYSLSEYLDMNPFAAEEMQLMLVIDRPEEPVHEFSIEYELEGGLLWRMTLPAVTFIGT